MAPEKFPVSIDVEARRATLRAAGPYLETRDAEDFETACRKLLDTRQDELVVDLCPVETIQSMLIGEVAKTKVIATEDGRKFRLVTNGKVADIFKMILNDLVDIEVPK